MLRHNSSRHPRGSLLLNSPTLLCEMMRQINSARDPIKSLARAVVVLRNEHARVIEYTDMQGDFVWPRVIAERYRGAALRAKASGRNRRRSAGFRLSGPGDRFGFRPNQYCKRAACCSPAHIAMAIMNTNISRQLKSDRAAKTTAMTFRCRHEGSSFNVPRTTLLSRLLLSGEPPSSHRRAPA